MMYRSERNEQFYSNSPAHTQRRTIHTSKGEIIVSHVLALGLTILLVTGSVFVFNAFRTQQTGPLAESQLKSICFQIKSAAESLWRPLSYPTNATMGRIIISLPLRAGGASYSAVMSNNTIFLSAPDASARCHSSVSSLSGSSAGGIAELSWIREGLEDRILLR